MGLLDRLNPNARRNREGSPFDQSQKIGPPVVRDAFERMLQVGDEIIGTESGTVFRITKLEEVTVTAPGVPPHMLVQLLCVVQMPVARGTLLTNFIRVATAAEIKERQQIEAQLANVNRPPDAPPSDAPADLETAPNAPPDNPHKGKVTLD